VRLNNTNRAEIRRALLAHRFDAEDAALKALSSKLFNLVVDTVLDRHKRAVEALGNGVRSSISKGTRRVASRRAWSGTTTPISI
jgi:hypothetical protein